MQGNDISAFENIGQATMFEGVLANPPDKATSKLKSFFAKQADDWDRVIAGWHPNPLPIKSLADCVNRRRIGTDVYTFLSPDAVDPINRWLVRKGISVPVYYYESVEALAEDLRYNRGIKVIYTSSHDHAMTLGMRATVVSPTQIWNV